VNSSGALCKIPTANSNGFIDRIYFFGKNNTSSFFFFVLIFFPTVIPSVYTEGIFLSVKSLRNLHTKIFSQYFYLYLSILVIELLLFFAFVKAGEIRFSETWTIVFELLRLQVTAEIRGSQGCRITRALESWVVSHDLLISLEGVKVDVCSPLLP